jgi:hypothetical protein
LESTGGSVLARAEGHAGRVGVSYSDHYAEQGIFRRLMDRLQNITDDGPRFAPVVTIALTG